MVGGNELHLKQEVRNLAKKAEGQRHSGNNGQKWDVQVTMSQALFI